MLGAGMEDARLFNASLDMQLAIQGSVCHDVHMGLCGTSRHRDATLNVLAVWCMMPTMGRVSPRASPIIGGMGHNAPVNGTALSFVHLEPTLTPVANAVVIIARIIRCGPMEDVPALREWRM